MWINLPVRIIFVLFLYTPYTNGLHQSFSIIMIENGWLKTFIVFCSQNFQTKQTISCKSVSNLMSSPNFCVVWLFNPLSVLHFGFIKIFFSFRRVNFCCCLTLDSCHKWYISNKSIPVRKNFSDSHVKPWYILYIRKSLIYLNHVPYMCGMKSHILIWW